MREERSPDSAGNIQDSSHDTRSFALTAEDMSELRSILRNHCDLSLDETEATVRGNELIMLYRVLLGPIPEDSEDLADSESSNIRALARFEERKLP